MSTLKQLRERVQADLDLQDETFISDSDINAWINESIKKAEAEIHALYEDYFLSETTITLSTGTKLYDYPSDIYGNKIRKLIFQDSAGSTSHEVKRVRNLAEASDRDIYLTGSNHHLEWTPYNDATNGRKIRIFPETGRSGTLRVWYIRNAKQLVDETVDEVTTLADAQSCDIDEFERYVLQAVKTECLFKDGDPRAIQSKQIEEQLKQNMINTLSNMVPDNNNEIVMDFSFYEDCEGE
jgi:hypothetical protein